MIFDTFLFSTELDLLEIRLNTLDAVVDRFVLVEGTMTHSGESKPLVFDANKDRFAPFLPKISHIVVDDWPQASGSVYDDAWMRERWQRDAILHGLTGCDDNDIIILGDADEIANPDAIANYRIEQGLCRLKQRMFYYYLNCENKDGWDWQKIAPYKLVKQLTPCGIRYPPAGETPLIEGGGWHWSMIGGSEAVRNKLSTYSHQEYNRPEILADVEAAINEGRDIFGRNVKYELVDIDESYPVYVRERVDELTAKGLIKGASKPTFADYSDKFLGEMEKLTSTVTEFGSCSAKPLTVTATISTKDRYTTTLPMCIASILMQTHLPEKLLIYDDGEQLDLRSMSPFEGLLKLADDKGVKWEIFKTPREGQVKNHAHALDYVSSDAIWRIDDDEVAEPTCLENLLAEMRESVGAVGGLVHHPGNVEPLPAMLDGSLNDIALGVNVAWFKLDKVMEVSHLYSTFLYRRSALRESGGYPKDLSIIGHHEESIASHQMFRAGWKLIVTPKAITHHLRESIGGIRSFNDASLWEHDEAIWQQYLATWGVVTADTKLIVCDMGLGDHLLLKGIWTDIRRKHPDTKYTLALCYPEVFKDVSGVNVISIAQAKLIVGDCYDDHSLYAHLWKSNHQGSVVDGMMEFWG